MTQGSGGPYIPNGQTTPIEFGSVPLGVAPPQVTFNLQNIGRCAGQPGQPGAAAKLFARWLIPVHDSDGVDRELDRSDGDRLRGSAVRSVELLDQRSHREYIRFQCRGQRDREHLDAAPTVTLPSPAAVYDPRFGAVAVDPGAVLTDDVPQTFATGDLMVDFASGGQTRTTWRSPARGAATSRSARAGPASCTAEYRSGLMRGATTSPRWSSRSMPRRLSPRCRRWPETSPSARTRRSVLVHATSR